LTDWRRKRMSKFRDRLFTVLTGLNMLLGIGLGAFYFTTWGMPGVEERVDQYVEVGSERFWFLVTAAFGCSLVFFVVTYVVSLDAQRSQRPRRRLYLLGIGLSAQATGYVAGSLGSTAYAIEYLLLSVGILGGGPLVIFGWEFALGRTLYGMGRLFYQFDNMRLSAWLMHKALWFDPGAPAVRRYYGLALARLGRSAEAVVALRRLLDAGLVDEEILRTLGNLYKQQDDSQSAITCYARLLELHPKERGLMDELTEMYASCGDIDRAIRVLEEHGDMQNLNDLVKLQRLYYQREDAKAKELCGAIARHEGPPYAQALLCYREMLRRYPRDVELLEQAAQYCLEVKHLEEAAGYLERIVEEAPAREDIRERLLASYRDQAQYQKMVPHFEFLLQGEKPRAELLSEYGEVLEHDKQYDEVLRWMQRAKDLYPLDYRFPYRLASLYYEMKNYEAAQREITAALALVDQSERSKLTVLHTKINGAILNRELRAIEDQISKDPNNLELRFQLIEKLTANAYVERAATELDNLLYQNPELKEKAMERLSQLIVKYDRTFLLLNYLADLHLKDHNWEKVLDFYRIMANQSLHPIEVLREGCRKILKIHPDYLPAIKTLGQLMKESGDVRGMVEHYGQVIELDPAQKRDVAQDMFDAYYSLKDYEKAGEFGPEAIEADPYRLENYKNLARTYEHLKRYRDALLVLDRAKRIDTQDRELYALMKKMDRQLKEEQLLELRDLLDRDPGNTEYHYELAGLYSSFGRYNEAILHYQKAGQQRLLANICKAKLAWCLAKKGMTDLAEESLAEVKVTEGDPEELAAIKNIMYEIGFLFEEARLPSKALRMYKQVFRIDAGFRDVVERIERLS
jgi:tetratricopeptide (TPR) repeat protein